MESGTTSTFAKSPHSSLRLLFLLPLLSRYRITRQLILSTLRTFTRPNVPRYPNYPEGVQGTDIPLDGAVVARLAHKRIMLEAGEEDAGKELMATAV